MSLNAEVHWIQGLGFEVEVREHHQLMDAKKEAGGRNRGPNPKEYVLTGLCGCTGMDVASLMKKFKVSFKTFDVSAQAESTKEHPIVFSEVHVTFKVTGENLDSELVKKAVDLSMTKYCGVSAMLSKAVPVNYSVLLNDELIHKGLAKFET